MAEHYHHVSVQKICGSGEGGEKTRAVYAAVDQSLEKDALGMMQSRERRENCCSYFEYFFFHLELKTSVNPTAA